jgi:hypothetical protein
MSYTWFKLHHEMPDDIKLRKFTPEEKWAWVALLCLASKSPERGVVAAESEDIADYCEFKTNQDWLYYRDKLIIKGMIEINADGNIEIVHWIDRQHEKPSDRPEAVKERVARHRAKKKNAVVTPCNALLDACNAGVTPQIRLEENRSEETRQEKKEDPNRDCSRNQKAPSQKSKLKGSDAIYATLAELDKFEKSWQWYCDRLKSIPPDKDGRKVSPGSKVKAAIAWRDFVEATNSIFVFKKSAPRYDFKQIGVPHFERFIRNGLWQIDLEPVTENDFIATDERSQPQLNPLVLAALAEMGTTPEEAFKHV